MRPAASASSGSSAVSGALSVCLSAEGRTASPRVAQASQSPGCGVQLAHGSYLELISNCFLIVCLLKGVSPPASRCLEPWGKIVAFRGACRWLGMCEGLGLLMPAAAWKGSVPKQLAALIPAGLAW